MRAWLKKPISELLDAILSLCSVSCYPVPVLGQQALSQNDIHQEAGQEKGNEQSLNHRGDIREKFVYNGSLSKRTGF
jgi:hypothetical protein